MEGEVANERTNLEGQVQVRGREVVGWAAVAVVDGDDVDEAVGEEEELVEVG